MGQGTSACLIATFSLYPDLRTHVPSLGVRPKPASRREKSRRDHVQFKIGTSRLGLPCSYFFASVINDDCFIAGYTLYCIYFVFIVYMCIYITYQACIHGATHATNVFDADYVQSNDASPVSPNKKRLLTHVITVRSLDPPGGMDISTTICRAGSSVRLDGRLVVRPPPHPLPPLSWKP